MYKRQIQKAGGLKVALADAVVDLQDKKLDIVATQGIARFTAAINALSAMNEGLERVVEDLQKELGKRPPQQPKAGGG